MKKTLVLLACVLVLALGYAFGQDEPAQLKGYSTVVPLRGNTVENVLRESEAGQTIPLWTYSTYTTVDNNLYTGQIMGGAPDTGTTTIPVYIVPLIVNMPDGGVFDPTAPDPTCAGGTPLTLVQNSPLFQTSGPFLWGNPPVNLGTTQYIDALQRAEFFRLLTLSATNSHWHTPFGLHTTNPVTVNVPSNEGQTFDFGGCSKIGVLNFFWLDNYVTNTLIPSLSGQGVGPTTFPMILMYNVVEASQGHDLHKHCCTLGYHGAYGSPMQVYSPAEFDTNKGFGKTAQDTSVLAHELGEAVNDPTGVNATPAWGHIGQQAGCQNNFEVGDPLTGTQYPPITLNGYTYHLQELAMYSWFFRPSQMVTPYPLAGDVGVLKWYSTNGTFLSDAGAICQ